MNKEKLGFVTLGDMNYFTVINLCTKKIKKYYPNSKIYIYDIGFSKEQARLLKNKGGVSLINWKNNIPLKEFKKFRRQIFEFLLKFKFLRYLIKNILPAYSMGRLSIYELNVILRFFRFSKHIYLFSTSIIYNFHLKL